MDAPPLAGVLDDVCVNSDAARKLDWTYVAQEFEAWPLGHRCSFRLRSGETVVVEPSWLPTIVAMVAVLATLVMLVVWARRRRA